MAKKRNKKPSQPRTFDGPAKSGEGQVHVIERFNEGTSGQKKRFRNIGHNPLKLAHRCGQITINMLDDGEAYREIYEMCHGRSGVDSTQALMSSRSGSESVAWVDSATNAGAALKRIDAAMPMRSLAIVQAFCGQGIAAPEAVRLGKINLSRPQGVWDRMREALEDLSEAMRSARRPQKAA